MLGSKCIIKNIILLVLLFFSIYALSVPLNPTKKQSHNCHNNVPCQQAGAGGTRRLPLNFPVPNPRLFELRVFPVPSCCPSSFLVPSQFLFQFLIGICRDFSAIASFLFLFDFKQVGMTEKTQQNPIRKRNWKGTGKELGQQVGTGKTQGIRGLGTGKLRGI